MPPAKSAGRTRSTRTDTKKRVLYFDQDRETKGTYRYAEAAKKGERGVMGTIWIQKAVAEELGCVDSVKVTLEPDDQE